jgi:hypothetical protein
MQDSGNFKSRRSKNTKLKGPLSLDSYLGSYKAPVANLSSGGGSSSFVWVKKIFTKLSVDYSFAQNRRKRPEFSILVIVALLIALGTLTLYAIGPAVLKRTGGGLGKQTLFLVVGLGGMWAAYKLSKLELLVKYAPHLMLFSLGLCVLILIPGVGKVVYGGRRWLSLGPLGSMQPSELVKAGVVFFLSGMAVYFKNSKLATKVQANLVAVFAGLVGIFVLILQRDLGTMLVISVIIFFVLIASGINKKVIVRLLILGLAGLSLSILMFGYRRDRLLIYLGMGDKNVQSAQMESPAEYHLALLEDIQKIARSYQFHGHKFHRYQFQLEIASSDILLEIPSAHSAPISSSIPPKEKPPCPPPPPKNI